MQVWRANNTLENIIEGDEITLNVALFDHLNSNLIYLVHLKFSAALGPENKGHNRVPNQKLTAFFCL